MNAQQQAYAQQIIAAVKAAGLPAKAAVIAIETALAESGLQLYANSNVPESLQYPHSAVGSDHDSLGIFQQQTPGWGTVANLMNPTYDTTRFIQALQSKSDWQSQDNWIAAQSVQNSGFADGSNYKAQDAQAQQIVAQYWGNAGAYVPSQPVMPPGSQSTGSATTNNADWVTGDTVAEQNALSIGGISIPDPLPWITSHIPGYKNTTDALTGIAQALSYVAQMFKDLLWIFQPGHFIKAWLYINGLTFILIGIYFLFSGSKEGE